MSNIHAQATWHFSQHTVPALLTAIPVQDPYDEMSGAYTTSKSGRTHRSTGMTMPSGNMSAGNFRASCAGAALLPTAKTGVSTSPFGNSHLVLWFLSTCAILHDTCCHCGHMAHVGVMCLAESRIADSTCVKCLR